MKSLEQKLAEIFTQNVDSGRPDRIKAAYERVMIEAGLMKDPIPKIWVYKDETKIHNK